ncbi:hypothetical protein ACP90_20385 [Labrenzia sp. CP4]|nr:hypothetical protein ACP90_20385 [Labrenzia sp. CP4]
MICDFKDSLAKRNGINSEVFLEAETCLSTSEPFWTLARIQRRFARNLSFSKSQMTGPGSPIQAA